MELSEQVRALLKQPLLARMSVIDPDGYPHTVPVWLGVDGDDLMVTSYRKTRKNEFIKANSKGAITIGGDPSGAEGYLFKGHFAVEEDPGYYWLQTITRLYEPPERAEELLAEWMQDDIIVLRFKVNKVSKI
jgi:hypothetical protein